MKLNRFSLFLSARWLFAMIAPASFAFDLSPGKPFPQVVLPSVADGRALSLADFQGEKVMLHLFASW